jgi:DNA-binding transcriptional MerR regulator
MTRPLMISQLAKATGVTAKTIRYYEDTGVLPRARRTAAGYRQYDQRGAQRVLFVRRARSLGLPLRHLRFLAPALDGRSQPPLRARLLTVVRERLATVQRQLVELERLRTQLEQVSARLMSSDLDPSRQSDRQSPEHCHCLEIEPLPVRWVGRQAAGG